MPRNFDTDQDKSPRNSQRSSPLTAQKFKLRGRAAEVAAARLL